MKKLMLVLALCLTAMLAFAGCGADKAATPADGKATIKVGATPVPHAEILNIVKPMLEKEGVVVEIVEMTDYVIPNTAVADKQLDANFFQHKPYLDKFCSERNLKLTSVAPIHIEPMGVYSKKVKALSELAEGAEVAIPNDPTNGGRALLLLAKHGVITLKDGVFAGPIAKFLSDEKKSKIKTLTKVKEGETLFFICDDKKNDTEKKAGLIRTWLAKKEQLDLIRDDAFEFCFVVDFPMYEIDEETGDTIFTHNPFSMPQGGMDALLNKEPTEVLAYQYDLVCNGIELASGAVRNHDIDIMKKAFDIAGYTEEELKSRFNALYTAFQYGAPPHAGMAPGIDRMVMLLTDEEKILDVIAFPLNGNAQDLLLGAPSEVTNQQLEDVHLLGSGSALAQRAAGSTKKTAQNKRSTFSNAQQLNQLALTDEEETVMQGIFTAMRESEQTLAACDTDGVEEMVHVMPMTNVLRDDVRHQPFAREDLLKGAPARSEDSWQVPRLVK